MVNHLTDINNQFKKQLPKNAMIQVLSFCIQVGVGICLVPYLIKYLGTSAYGLIPIAGVMTQYASLISQSISGAVSRFLTIAIQKKDSSEAARIFNTAFFSYLIIGLLQIPIYWLSIKNADSLISIPRELYDDAIILLSCSASAFVINLVSSVFAVPAYANNRLDISRSIDIFRYLSRVAGVAVLFTVFSPALRYVGYVDLAISIMVVAMQAIVSRRLEPGLKIRIHSFDVNKIRELLGMGGWLLVNNIGTLLFLQIDVWVCNRFIGPDAAGEYAAVLQWPLLIRQGGAVMSSVIAPMILICFARGEIANLLRISKLAVRSLSLFLAVPIGVMCVFSSSLLTMWLGPAFTHLAPLMILMLFHLVVNVGALPLFNIQVAMNKVKLPAIVTLVMGILNLVLAILLVTYFKLGVFGVAIAGAVVLTAKNALFTPIYAARIQRVPWYSFLGLFLQAIGLTMCFLIAAYAFRYLNITAYSGSLALLIAATSFAGFCICWAILPKSDRHELLSIVPFRYGSMKTTGYKV